MQLQKLLNLYNDFVTDRLPYLDPDPDPTTFPLLAGDVSFFVLIFILALSLRWIYHRIHGPAYSTNLPPTLTDQPRTRGRLPPISGILGMLMPQANTRDPYNTDDTWDFAFYRNAMRDTGEYILETPPPTPERAKSPPPTPPDQRPVLSWLAQQGGPFRALRDQVLLIDPATRPDMPEPLDQWPDTGLAGPFPDPEMTRVANRLMELRLYPDEVLGAMRVTWPGMRMGPVYTGVGQIRRAHLTDIRVLTTGIQNLGISAEDTEDLGGILNALYRLKVVVDRELEKARPSPVPADETLEIDALANQFSRMV